MTDNDDFRAYLDEASDEASAQHDRIYVDVPPLPPTNIERAASGLSPMERIALEGRAYRGLASGAQPWWIIIAGWIIFGLPCLMLAVALGSSGSGVAVVWAIAFYAIVIWIMCRGTSAKLEQQKKQQQRKAKYRSGMDE